MRYRNQWAPEASDAVVSVGLGDFIMPTSGTLGRVDPDSIGYAPAWEPTTDLAVEGLAMMGSAITAATQTPVRGTVAGALEEALAALSGWVDAGVLIRVCDPTVGPNYVKLLAEIPLEAKTLQTTRPMFRRMAEIGQRHCVGVVLRLEPVVTDGDGEEA